MKVIIGLGNPGKKYARTRHNVGFDVVEILSERNRIPLDRIRLKCLLGEGRLGTERVVLAQPQTFMNLSGEAVVQLVNWYKVEPQDVLVIYDDVDLPLGHVRIRKNGSAGTHNGMKSVIGLWGESGFPRIRVGVGGKPQGWDLADYVLSHYPKEEQEAIFEAYTNAAEAAEVFVTRGIEDAMREYNTRKPPKAKKAASDEPMNGEVDG